MKLSIDPYPSPYEDNSFNAEEATGGVALMWKRKAKQKCIWVLQKTRIILNLNSFILWGEVWGKGWMTGTQLSTHAFYTILFLFEGKWLERLDLNISTQTVPTWISLSSYRLDLWAARQRRGARTGRDELMMILYISTGSNEYYSSTSRDETSLGQLNKFAEAARNITRDDSKPSLGSVPGCKAIHHWHSGKTVYLNWPIATWMWPKI